MYSVHNDIAKEISVKTVHIFKIATYAWFGSTNIFSSQTLDLHLHTSAHCPEDNSDLIREIMHASLAQHMSYCSLWWHQKHLHVRDKRGIEHYIKEMGLLKWLVTLHKLNNKLLFRYNLSFSAFCAVFECSAFFCLVKAMYKYCWYKTIYSWVVQAWFVARQINAYIHCLIFTSMYAIIWLHFFKSFILLHKIRNHTFIACLLQWEKKAGSGREVH